MIIEAILIGTAGALFGRAVFWHVPKLALMIWRGTQPTPEPVQVAAQFDYDAHERALFAAVPSAFWLEPTRWTRPTWPAKPTEDDLAWDKSTDDLLLAHASLDDVWRARFKHDMEEQAWLGGRRRPSSAPPPISSTRRFDRRY